MTKNVARYHGKRQIFLFKNKLGPSSEKWSKIKYTIFQDYLQNGYVITGICYNHGLKEYLFVVTESTSDQNYKWFKPTEESEKQKWEEKEYKEEKRHPTIYFRDPNDLELLVVYTFDAHRLSLTHMSCTGFQLERN